MKRIISILSFVFIAVAAYGQRINISYAPTSVQGWGTMPQTSLFLAEVKIPADYWINDYVSIGLIHIQTDIGNAIILDTRSGNKYPVSKLNNPWGIFIKPVNIAEPLWIFTAGLSAGVVYFSQAIPVQKDGERINVIFTFILKKKLFSHVSVGLSYTHISNAFRGAVNPGYDFPSVTIDLKF